MKILIFLVSFQAFCLSTDQTMRAGGVIGGVGFSTMVLSLILLGGRDEPKLEQRKELDPVFYSGFSLVLVGFLLMSTGIKYAQTGLE
ncbi:MAG: hypothetical protein WCK49_03095 [Myxococcaceae bacterium]